MSLLLCRREKVKHPFYIEVLGIHIYSSQELCYVIYHHPLLVMNDFVDASLFFFVKNELGLGFLAGRMEKLVEFKVAYGNSIRAVSRCLEKFFPAMSTQDIQGFIYAFFPFLFGAYPYTFVTEQQRQAMERAGVAHVQLSLYEITYSCARRLLEGYGAQAT